MSLFEASNQIYSILLFFSCCLFWLICSKYFFIFIFYLQNILFFLRCFQISFLAYFLNFSIAHCSTNYFTILREAYIFKLNITNALNVLLMHLNTNCNYFFNETYRLGKLYKLVTWEELSVYWNSSFLKSIFKSKKLKKQAQISYNQIRQLFYTDLARNLP